MRHVEAQAIQFDFISQHNIGKAVSCKIIRIRIYGLRCLLSEAEFDSVGGSFDNSYMPNTLLSN